MSCLILIGMMGAGKTTVGKELARRRKMRFAEWGGLRTVRALRIDPVTVPATT